MHRLGLREKAAAAKTTIISVSSFQLMHKNTFYNSFLLMQRLGKGAAAVTVMWM